jgi:hypothetical protein
MADSSGLVLFLQGLASYSEFESKANKIAAEVACRMFKEFSTNDEATYCDWNSNDWCFSDFTYILTKVCVILDYMHINAAWEVGFDEHDDTLLLGTINRK